MVKTIIKPTIKEKPKYTDSSKDQLIKLLFEAKEEAVVLKRNMRMGDVQNLAAYRLKRREIARIKTALNSATTKGEDK